MIKTKNYGTTMIILIRIFFFSLPKNIFINRSDQQNIISQFFFWLFSIDYINFYNNEYYINPNYILLELEILTKQNIYVKKNQSTSQL